MCVCMYLCMRARMYECMYVIADVPLINVDVSRHASIHICIG